LRRYDRKADLQLRHNGYDVNLVSVAVEMNGVVAATLFFPLGKDASAKRATRFGWKDETEAWGRHLRGDPPPAKVPPVAETKSASPVTRSPVPERVTRPESADAPVSLPGLSKVARKPRARVSDG
jgi:hypothetical protein